MAQRKPRERDMLDSMYSMLALVFILVACVELCDAATVVDVYRLIQYDISGVPFGSRFATLNHHAGSLHFPSGADLSRTVVMIPLRELNITFVRGNFRFWTYDWWFVFAIVDFLFVAFTEYVSRKQPLGGLLFLLPEMFKLDNGGSSKGIQDKQMMKNVLVELERLLVHSKIPVSPYSSSLIPSFS